MKNCTKKFVAKNLFPVFNYWILAIVIVLLQSSALAQPLDQDFPVTNGGIDVMHRDGNILYIGGYFNYVGPNTGRGVFLDINSGSYDVNFPKVNGDVYACISDNNGGWYIGGTFTKVGNSYRNNVAQILSDGTVSNWNPGTNGSIRTIALNGSTVYLGGSFTQVGGVARDFAAAVDAITGATTSWNPQPDGLVWSIVATNDVVYVGGSFLTLNPSPVPRTNLAAVNISDGAVTSWSCDVSAYNINLPFAVYGLMLQDNDSTLYIWGNITSIGGTARKGIGRVNTYLPNSVQSWNPNVLASASFTIPGLVYTVAVSGDTVFIGGNFTRIRTTSTIRNRIAAVTKGGTPTALSWNPNISADWYDNSVYNKPEVFSLEVSDSLVYAGGTFNLVGGNRRHNLVAINRSDGLISSFDPHIADYSTIASENGVYTLLLDNNKIFAGGQFSSVNGVTRKAIAAINLLNNTVTDWNPKLNTEWGWDPTVSTIAHHGSNVFIGGDIDSVGDQYRRAFVTVDNTTGLPTNFLASSTFNTLVTLLRVQDDKLFISANFSTIGDSVRNRLACIDLLTEQVTAWNPQIGGFSGYETVNSIAFSGSTIYLGGGFETVQGVSRSRLAAVDDVFGIPTSWDPNNGNASGLAAYNLKIANSAVYLAGTFSQVGSEFRNGLASIDFNGNVLPWNPNVIHSFDIARVYDIDIAGSTLYAGGNFTSVNGLSRRGIAAIDINSGTPTNWVPAILGELRSVIVNQTDKNVYLGGYFETINDDPAYCLGSYMDQSITGTTTFQLTVTVDDSWNLVSIPGLHPTDQNVNTWWSGRDINTPVYKFSNGYEAITTATPGEGYWMFHLGPNTYNTGDEWPVGGINLVPNNPITAVSGWNLIGGYENTAATSGVTTTPAGLITGSFYQYIPNTGYQTATTLTPGYGYWVELTGAGSINIPSALEKTTNTSVNKIKENWGKIIINDAAGKSGTLYSTNESSELNSFNLPPLPPAGLFDVRFGSQRFVEDLYSSSNTIELNGVTYPVTISVEGMDLNLEDAIDGSKVNTVVKDGNSFVLYNSSVNVIKVSSENIVPMEYSLDQNYPNPFNPATTIKFSLPEVSDVKLTIYNTIGQRVALIINSTMDAGSYSIKWDASNVASGLYFYELSTKNFKSVKKMMLLK